MNLAPSADQLSLQARARELMDEHVRDRAAELDARGEFPEEVRRLLADHGLFRTAVAPEYGGVDGSLLTSCLVLEEIARVHASSSMVLGNQYLAVGPIALFGSEAQKQRYLPPLGTGEILGSFALTEPEAGSDAGRMQTEAVRDGDGWRLRGRKVFITNADVADVLTVFAKAEGHGRRSITAFLLERGSHDWAVEGHERKMGLHASTTCSLVLDDVWVPDANRIGEAGDGMRIALGGLNKGRISTASQAVGIAQGALDAVLEHLASGVGTTSWESQAVQFGVAELEADVEATRALVHKAAWRFDTGAGDLIRIAAITKLYATDMVNRVTSRAVELLGDAGYTTAHPVERMMRDARVYAIFEGTNEIQKLVIARELRKRTTEPRSP
jgi:alkylation response protein AidB-like acyl-CoA dehydrogenase